MQELEKILEEIIEQLKAEGCIIDDAAGNRAEEIIHDHMNDGWIPVEERLPDVPEGTEDQDCPEFNVTIKGASQSTTLKYSWDGAWFDDSGYLYNVIAWRPLPEPYRKNERSNIH